MIEFENDEKLKKRGLKRVIMYCAVFWDRDNGYTSTSFKNSQSIEEMKGYGDFAGMSKVTCIVPLDA